jgi:hypothetical protein
MSALVLHSYCSDSIHQWLLSCPPLAFEDVAVETCMISLFMTHTISFGMVGMTDKGVLDIRICSQR